MSKRRVPTYWERREKARQERRATVIDEQRHAQRERHEGRIYADDEKIIAALERIRDHQQTNNQQQNADSARSDTWERRRFWLEVLAVIAAFIGAWILKGTLNEARHATVEANRAWIAPDKFSFQLPDKYTPGEDSSGTVYFYNVGKSPAKKLNPKFWGGSITTADINSKEKVSSAVQQITEGNSCSNQPVDDLGYTVFPSNNPPPHFSNVQVPANILSPEIWTGSRLLVVVGCFSYETYGQRHYTAVCKYMQPEANAPPKQWRFLFCPTGNDAN